MESIRPSCSSEHIVKADGAAVFAHEEQLIELRLLRAEENHLHAYLLEQRDARHGTAGIALEAAHSGALNLLLQLLHAAEHRENRARGAAERLAQLTGRQCFDALTRDDVQRGGDDLLPS